MLRQSDIAFSSTQHRAVTYVREVSGWIRQTALLPGGAYNYGSENDLTMLETAEWLKAILDLPVRLQDVGPRHHLWMDCSKIKKHGINFCSTIDGLQKCIADYAL
jgi:dTDP-4-dehydrorhamnose reductase